MPRRNSASAAMDRRLKVARLYYRGGMTQEKLAAKFGVTQAQISHDIQWVKDYWREQMGDGFEDLKVEVLTDLAMVKAEAKRGWRRSLRNAERRLAKVVSVGDGERKETQKTEEGRSGDPRFLTVVREVYADLRKMLGMDAATKIKFTDDELNDLIARELARLAGGGEASASGTAQADPDPARNGHGRLPPAG